MSAILEPRTITSDQLSQLGGKARSLYELERVDEARVPAWFAVAADAFADAVDTAGIAVEIEDALRELRNAGDARNGAERCHASLAPLIATLRVSESLRGAIEAAYDDLSAEFVAVRSSALDEDGAERSFAGCLDTSLFVRGIDDVVAAVERCWRSAFSERSLAYRAVHHALDTEIRVGVVVQRMIAGHVSGVLFTANPANGDRDQAIVTSTWGLGDGVVSGRLSCDTFVVGRNGAGIIDRELADKSHAILLDADRGTGTAEVENTAAQRSAASLDDEQLAKLAHIGWAIEDAYGMPVDIEWTWSEEGPWVLQARPITALAAAATGATQGASDPTKARRGRHRIWDNSNIIESYSGVTTPLTYSFARSAYAVVYRQAFALLGVSPTDIAANDAIFEQMIGLLRGRVYYNLESWYVVLKLLPGYNFNAEFMEQMMGVAESLRGEPAPPSSAAKRYLVELPKLVTAITQLLGRFAGAEKLIEDFFANFKEAHTDLSERDMDNMGLDELVDAYAESETRILQRWQAPIVNDLLAMMFFGGLRKAISAWHLDEHSSLQNDLLCGEGGLESTEPTRNLLRIMVDVRADQVLCELLATAAPDMIRNAVESEERFGWLRVRIAAHVDRFGDRCVDELKLEEPTLRDDPTFLYAALKGYLAAPPITVEQMETRERAIRSAAEERFLDKLKWRPARRRLFEWLLAGARRHVKYRENLRFARTRAFGLVRRQVVAMGRRLAEAGKLEHPADVFYLEIDELIGYARGTATTTDLRGLAEVRKREFATYRRAGSPPDRFETDGAVYLDERATAAPTQTAEPGETLSSGERLDGLGASPGTVRAPARLIIDPRTAHLSGQVLVAHRTDPGWVPLFPSAAAVVVERGSVLSHSAIVAREFGIPCVVSARDALTRLRDGQLIEVNGNTGHITALEA